MFKVLIVLLIGVVIGWNFPQPAFAKAAQDFIVRKVKGFFNKPEGE